MSQPLPHASKSARPAQPAAADNEQRDPLTPSDVCNLLGRIAELLDRRRFDAGVLPERDGVLPERPVRLPAAIRDVDEGNPGLMSAGDPARELDAAPGIGRAVAGHQDVPREVPALRWTARNEHGKLRGVHSGGRGATENHVSRTGITRAGNHKQVGARARVEKQTRGVTAPNGADARRVSALRRKRLWLLERTPDGAVLGAGFLASTLRAAHDGEERQLRLRARQKRGLGDCLVVRGPTVDHAKDAAEGHPLPYSDVILVRHCAQRSRTVDRVDGPSKLALSPVMSQLSRWSP